MTITATTTITPAEANTIVCRLTRRIGHNSAPTWAAKCAGVESQLGLLALKCGNRQSADRHMNNASALRTAASNARRQWR